MHVQVLSEAFGVSFLYCFKAWNGYRHDFPTCLQDLDSVVSVCLLAMQPFLLVLAAAVIATLVDL